MKKKEPKIISITVYTTNVFGMSAEVLIGLADDGKVYKYENGKWKLR